METKPAGKFAYLIDRGSEGWTVAGRIGRELCWFYSGSTYEFAKERVDEINAAHDADVAEKVEEAVNLALKSCAEFARTEGHEKFGRQILEQRDLLIRASKEAKNESK